DRAPTLRRAQRPCIGRRRSPPNRGCLEVGALPGRRTFPGPLWTPDDGSGGARAPPVGPCGRRHALRGRSRRLALTDRGAVLLRRLDPETAHGLAIRALRVVPLPPAPADDPILATTVAGLALPNPVGLAAGLDKNGEALHGLSRLGFGFIECGSVTPLAQP